MTYADECITRFRTHKAAALLAYLAMHPGKAFSRDLLLDLIWSDQGPEAGRAALSNALTSLRNQLEKTRGLAGSVFLTDHQTIRLNPQTVTTDIQEFETFLQMAARAASVSAERDWLEKALTCYQPEMLTGFFEDWVDTEQRRLQERYIQAATRLCLVLEQSGCPEAALEISARLLEADPLAETTYQTRMRLHLALGQPQAALQTYETLTALLEAELSALPLEATQQLAEQARHFQPPVRSGSLPVATIPSPSPISSAPPSPQTPPIPASPDLPTPSLPLQLTRFFGRETERRRLQHLLTAASTRLVTLLGPGGVGKTRLAIEVARSLTAEYGGRITFVSLAEVRDPAHLPIALAAALKIAPDAANDPFEAALKALEGGPYLLLLDNLEQLLFETPLPSEDRFAPQSDLRGLIRTLLERAPQVTCLLTSRQPLGLAGEQEFLVSALHTPGDPLPTAENLPSDACALNAYASVALYADRVRLVKPDFVVTASNEHAVAALCQRLEGMPLAIEMAAAWGRTLSPRRTLERLAKRLDLQVSRRSDLPGRHQSLRATLEWSYDLLSPALQAHFAALSVFRGGWSLEAFEKVGDAEVQALMELSERSLVVVEEQERGEVRYRLLETLHEFVVEKREERGETERLQRRHATYFLQFAEEMAALQRGGKNKTVLMRLEADHDNLRAALAWCLSAAGDTQMGLRLCGALAYFWEMQGHPMEGYAWCMAALQAEGAQERNRARATALSGAGRLAEFQPAPTLERALYEECRAIAEEIGDAPYLALSYNNLALLAHTEGDLPEARRLYTESLTLNRALGNRIAIARNLNNLGMLSASESDYPMAQKLYQEALTINRELGNRMSEAGNLNNLGLVCYRQGENRTARRLYEEALALNRELGNRLWESTNLKNLGDVCLESGDTETALTRYEQAVALNHEMGYRAREAANRNSMGKLHQQRGDYAAARSCYQQSLHLSRETEDMAELFAVLESISWLSARESGLAVAPAPPVPADHPLHAFDAQEREPALPRSPQTFVFLRQAALLWGAVQSLRVEFHTPTAQDQKPCPDVRDAIRIPLGASLLEAALAEGQTLSLEQTIACAQSCLLQEPSQPTDAKRASRTA